MGDESTGVRPCPFERRRGCLLLFPDDVRFSSVIAAATANLPGFTPAGKRDARAVHRRPPRRCRRPGEPGVDGHGRQLEELHPLGLRRLAGQSQLLAPPFEPFGTELQGLGGLFDTLFCRGFGSQHPPFRRNSAGPTAPLSPASELLLRLRQPLPGRLHYHMHRSFSIESKESTDNLPHRPPRLHARLPKGHRNPTAMAGSRCSSR